MMKLPNQNRRDQGSDELTLAARVTLFGPPPWLNLQSLDTGPGTNQVDPHSAKLSDKITAKQLYNLYHEQVISEYEQIDEWLSHKPAFIAKLLREDPETVELLLEILATAEFSTISVADQSRTLAEAVVSYIQKPDNVRESLKDYVALLRQRAQKPGAASRRDLALLELIDNAKNTSRNVQEVIQKLNEDYGLHLPTEIYHSDIVASIEGAFWTKLEMKEFMLKQYRTNLLEKLRNPAFQKSLREWKHVPTSKPFIVRTLELKKWNYELLRAGMDGSDNIFDPPLPEAIAAQLAATREIFVEKGAIGDDYVAETRRKVTRALIKETIEADDSFKNNLLNKDAYVTLDPDFKEHAYQEASIDSYRKLAERLSLALFGNWITPAGYLDSDHTVVEDFSKIRTADFEKKALDKFREDNPGVRNTYGPGMDVADSKLRHWLNKYTLAQLAAPGKAMRAVREKIIYYYRQIELGGQFDTEYDDDMLRYRKPNIKNPDKGQSGDDYFTNTEENPDDGPGENTPPETDPYQEYGADEEDEKEDSDATERADMDTLFEASSEMLKIDVQHMMDRINRNDPTIELNERKIVWAYEKDYSELSWYEIALKFPPVGKTADYVIANPEAAKKNIQQHYPHGRDLILARIYSIYEQPKCDDRIISAKNVAAQLADAEPAQRKNIGAVVSFSKHRRRGTPNALEYVAKEVFEIHNYQAGAHQKKVQDSIEKGAVLLLNAIIAQEELNKLNAEMELIEKIFKQYK